MENATKALLIAGGVLIAILIIIVFARLSKSSVGISKTYDSSVKLEEVAIFNANFNQYIGQKLTVHQAVTVTNFAKSNGVQVINSKEIDDIMQDVNKQEAKKKKYTIKINSYDENGYVKSITIS